MADETEQTPISEGVNPELRNQVTWKIPNALVLIGSRSGDDWNGMTASWVTQVSMEPVMIGVGVDNKALTHRLMSEGRSFTVNLWNAEDAKVFVKFSKPAVHQVTPDGVHMLNDRPVHVVKTGAPVFDEAIAWLDCSVRHATDFGTHTFFVGEIVDAGLQKPEARAAAISDTRLKYGGVKRGGQ
jgi:flavin reductase (DIM6/NTAB) family NADH-FMN oxidoreductase RutF